MVGRRFGTGCPITQQAQRGWVGQGWPRHRGSLVGTWENVLGAGGGSYRQWGQRGVPEGVCVLRRETWAWGPCLGQQPCGGSEAGPYPLQGPHRLSRPWAAGLTVRVAGPGRREAASLCPTQIPDGHGGAAPQPPGPPFLRHSCKEGVCGVGCSPGHHSQHGAPAGLRPSVSFPSPSVPATSSAGQVGTCPFLRLRPAGPHLSIQSDGVPSERGHSREARSSPGSLPAPWCKASPWPSGLGSEAPAGVATLSWPAGHRDHDSLVQLAPEGRGPVSRFRLLCQRCCGYFHGHVCAHPPHTYLWRVPGLQPTCTCGYNKQWQTVSRRVAPVPAQHSVMVLRPWTLSNTWHMYAHISSVGHFGDCAGISFWFPLCFNFPDD